MTKSCVFDIDIPAHPPTLARTKNNRRPSVADKGYQLIIAERPVTTGGICEDLDGVCGGH